MKWELIIIFTIIIILIFTIAIIYCLGLNKISIFKTKIDNSNENITKELKKKYDLMNKLYAFIKKVIKKKDYLKDFIALKNKNLSNYELDIELNNHLTTMIHFKEDYKELNNNEFNSILEEIKELDQSLVANKRYFNKNNNALSKSLKGYIKYIAKINNIKIKTSYEVKKKEDL